MNFDPIGYCINRMDLLENRLREMEADHAEAKTIKGRLASLEAWRKSWEGTISKWPYCAMVGRLDRPKRRPRENGGRGYRHPKSRSMSDWIWVTIWVLAIVAGLRYGAAIAIKLKEMGVFKMIRDLRIPINAVRVAINKLYGGGSGAASSAKELCRYVEF